MIRVTVWNEYFHEQEREEIKKIYPDGIHGAIASFLKTDEELEVKTATLYDEECGLTEEVLNNTDVLIWWAHIKHNDVPDEIAMRVQAAVLKGMGLIVLHSGHHSKPFKLLMGTTCNLSWRESGDSEKIWVVAPEHPIAEGIDRYFDLPHEETYGECFDIPEPDKLIFIANFSGGEVFRAGCCFRRGRGKIFYFQPGHESYPTYYDSRVQRIIKNAVHWAEPESRVSELICPHVSIPEPKFDNQ